MIRGKGVKTTVSGLVPSMLLAGPQTVELAVLDLIAPVPLSGGGGRLLVDALHGKTARFYRGYGFRETAENALTLYLPLGAS